MLGSPRRWSRGSRQLAILVLVVLLPAGVALAVQRRDDAAHVERDRLVHEHVAEARQPLELVHEIVRKARFARQAAHGADVVVVPVSRDPHRGRRQRPIMGSSVDWNDLG